MVCTKCGESNNSTPDKNWTGRVIEINNPSSLTYFKLVNIPASMGDEKEYPAKNGLYRNVILKYEASENIYIYTSDGIPALITGDLQSIRDAIRKLEKYSITETEAREAKDTDLQDQIDTIKASSDVVDIVATYADLVAYDTSHLTKDDIVKVLKDESRDSTTTYYRWTDNKWSFVGGVGPYYTQAEVKGLLDTEAVERKNADTALRTDIDSLSSSFADEVIAREASDATLQENLTTETKERKTADDAIKTDLATEKTERKNADASLLSSINTETTARKAGDKTNADAIAAETTARTTTDESLQTQINAVKATADAALTPDDIDYTVVSDFALNSTTSTTTIQIDSDRVNLKTGTTSAKEIPLPVASSTQAGIMNSATFEAVTTNTTNVNALLNGTVAVSGLPESATQAQITAAWKEATGLASLINRASVYDTTNSKVWTYYANTATWYAATNTTQIEIDPFTNTKAGTIKGSTGEGQVFAENDGTGSVNGWDALNGRVSTLEGAGYITENNISTLRSTVATNTTNISDLDDTKANTADLATVATSGSYNDLTNKPTIPAAITVDSAVSATSTNPVQNKAISTALSGKQATLTTAQLAAANSGITAAKVTTYDGYAATISNKANTADLATVATSGKYSDLSGTPTIPTVNNATLTVQQDGTTLGTFTANSATNTTINITTPTFTAAEWTALWA